MGCNDRKHKKEKMTRLTIIFLTLIGGLLFTQCINQKNIKKMKIFEKELVFPDISPEFEELTSSELEDILEKKETAYENELQNKNRADSVLSYRYEEYKKGEKIVYGFSDRNNILNIMRYIKIEPDNSNDYNKSFYFMEREVYSLKDYKPIEKALSLWSGSSFCMFLKRYDFDASGNVIYDYEHSKNFKQSLSDILRTLERHNLEKHDLIVNFNNTKLSFGNYSYVTKIEPVISNHGKIWRIQIGTYNAIIDDGTGEIIVHNSYAFLKDKYREFQFIKEDNFKREYSERSVQEVEKETGILIIVYEDNYKAAYPDDWYEKTYKNRISK